MQSSNYEEADGFASRMIPFVKYTSCGNNFVIVDATVEEPLDEIEWSSFAAKATSTSFGIGCDNLIVIQRSTPTTIDAISEKRQYWKKRPDLSAAEFIFRMFEPNGEEAACCGNGLICVANYLHKQHGVIDACIATEIPMPVPNVLDIGSHGDSGSWVNLGLPRKLPSKLYKAKTGASLNSCIDIVEELTINFRLDDLKAYTNDSSLTVKGYLVFTGEPHLVIFPDLDFTNPTLADMIFGSTVDGTIPEDNRKGMGAWLVHRIGIYINKRCRDMFPEGVSVNFARINNLDVVENRCFERGINRETLACSTGALAVAYVVQKLFSLEISNINLLPIRCREEDGDALIRIQLMDTGWCLTTTPHLLFEGIYRMPKINVKASPANDYLIAESNIRMSEQRLALLSPEATLMCKGASIKQ